MIIGLFAKPNKKLIDSLLLINMPIIMTLQCQRLYLLFSMDCNAVK